MKASRIKFEPRRIHDFGLRLILFGLVVLVSIQSSNGTTTATTANTTTKPKTTSADIFFDLALAAQLFAFKFRDEEPAFANETEFLDKNVEDWSFAYDGGEAKGERPADNKPITWAIGLIGIDYFGKTFRVNGMGALIHPQIVMTLCASINSYYRSYKGLLFEELATKERFQRSNSSDPQFDITTPTIFAYWTSQYGFKSKKGEENVMEVSRHILTTEACTDAVDGRHYNQTVMQYITPAFLLLRDYVTNPFGGGKPAHLTNFLQKTNDDKVTWEYRKRAAGFNLEMMSYKQRVCTYPPNITQLRSLKVWREPTSGEVVEAGLHLLNTRWEELSIDTQDRTKVDPWDIHTLKSCDFNAFKRWREADHDSKHDPPLPYGKVFKTAMTEILKKPRVACLEWFWGNLCDAPVGSPVFYWQKKEGKPGADFLIGLSITSPKSLNYAKADKSVHIMVMMLTQEAGKENLVKEINGLITYVKNLARTREIAENYPSYNEIEEAEEIPLDIVGNLDSDLVPRIVKIFKKEEIIEKSRAVRISLAPPVILLMTLTSLILMYSSS